MDKNKITYVRSNPINGLLQISTNHRINWTTIKTVVPIESSLLVFVSDITIGTNITFVLTQNLIVNADGYKTHVNSVNNYESLFNTGGYKLSIYNLHLVVLNSSLKQSHGWLVYSPNSSKITITNCIVDATICEKFTGGFVGETDHDVFIKNSISMGQVTNGSNGFDPYKYQKPNIVIENSYASFGVWNTNEALEELSPLTETEIKTCAFEINDGANKPFF